VKSFGGYIVTDKKPESKKLVLDPDAAAASAGQPAFLSKPPGSPAYHGFPLIPETCIEGWCYGALTEFAGLSACTEGDGYVQAPDGSRAGLVWEVGIGDIREISPPDLERWGVYEVWFPRAIYNVADLRDCFAHVLPRLRAKFAELKGGRTA